MKYIKLLLMIFLISNLIACASNTKAEEEKISKDKKAAKLNVELASGYMKRGNFEVAQEKLLKAIVFDDTYVPGYTTLAVLMNILGKPDEAEKYYLNAMELDNDDPNLQNNYGTFLCGVGKYEQAVELFEKTLNNQFYKTPALAHANIGYCLMQEENPDYEKIELHLREALKLYPKMATAMLAMAELAIKTKKYLMARAYSQRFHAIAKPTAESLWVQAQAEHALGDKKYFVIVSQSLLTKFPASEQATKLMELPNL